MSVFVRALLTSELASKASDARMLIALRNGDHFISKLRDIKLNTEHGVEVVELCECKPCDSFGATWLSPSNLTLGVLVDQVEYLCRFDRV